MSKETHKKVGVWIRTSTDLDSQKDAPEHHLERAKAYCSFKEWKIVEVYDLSATSGKAVLDLPTTKQMLEDVQTGKITGLIFSKLARLARSTKELLELADFFKKHNADLISLGESIDTSTPAGTLFFTVLAALAQFEREEIADRVKKSVPIRAKLGKSTGGQAPFGYSWKNNQLKVNYDEAIIVRKMFDIFSDNHRKKTTARLLNEAGHRTRKGANFSDATIDRLLRNPTMKGLHRANYTQSRGEGKHWDIKPEDQWVYSEVEPIVSEQLWEDVNEFLDNQRKSRRKVARKPSKHMFSGLTFCHCGQKMYVLSGSPSYTCTKCRNKIHKDDLESVYETQLEEFLLSRDEIEKYVLTANTALQDKKDQLNLLKKQEQEVSSQMDKLYDLYMSEAIGKAGFERKNSPLEGRLVQIKSELPTLEGTVKAMEQKALSSEHIASETAWLHGKWSSLSLDNKHKVIELITDKIVIHNNEVELHFHYLPFSTN